MTNMRDKKIPVGWSPLVISSNFIHFLWEVRAPTQPWLFLTQVPLTLLLFLSPLPHLLLALKLPAYSMLTLHFALPRSHIHNDSYYPLWFQDVLPKGITPDCQCITLNPILCQEGLKTWRGVFFCEMWWNGDSVPFYMILLERCREILLVTSDNDLGQWVGHGPLSTHSLTQDPTLQLIQT